MRWAGVPENRKITRRLLEQGGSIIVSIVI
jgi:hypothetical protein